MHSGSIISEPLGNTAGEVTAENTVTVGTQSDFVISFLDMLGIQSGFDRNDGCIIAGNLPEITLFQNLIFFPNTHFENITDITEIRQCLFNIIQRYYCRSFGGVILNQEENIFHIVSGNVFIFQIVKDFREIHTIFGSIIDHLIIGINGS